MVHFWDFLVFNQTTWNFGLEPVLIMVTCEATLSLILSEMAMIIFWDREKISLEFEKSMVSSETDFEPETSDTQGN